MIKMLEPWITILSKPVSNLADDDRVEMMYIFPYIAYLKCHEQQIEFGLYGKSSTFFTLLKRRKLNNIIRLKISDKSQISNKCF